MVCISLGARACGSGSQGTAYLKLGGRCSDLLCPAANMPASAVYISSTPLCCCLLWPLRNRLIMPAEWSPAPCAPMVSELLSHGCASRSFSTSPVDSATSAELAYIPFALCDAITNGDGGLGLGTAISGESGSEIAPGRTLGYPAWSGSSSYGLLIASRICGCWLWLPLGACSQDWLCGCWELPPGWMYGCWSELAYDEGWRWAGYPFSECEALEGVAGPLQAAIWCSLWGSSFSLASCEGMATGWRGCSLDACPLAFNPASRPDD